MNNDLARSHSKWSNFKLTLKSLLLVISFNLLWVILFFKDKLSENNQLLFYSLLGLDAIVIILLMISFHNFKR
jgi:hypothetical protein